MQQFLHPRRVPESSSLSGTSKKSFFEKILPQDAEDIMLDFAQDIVPRRVQIAEEFLWDGAVTDRIKMMARTSSQALPESMTVPVGTSVKALCARGSIETPPENSGDPTGPSEENSMLYRCTDNGVWVSDASEELTILTCRHFSITVKAHHDNGTGYGWAFYDLAFRKEDEGTDFPLKTLVDVVHKAIAAREAVGERVANNQSLLESVMTRSWRFWLLESEERRSFWNSREPLEGDARDLPGRTIQLVRSFLSQEEFQRIRYGMNRYVN